MRRFTGKIGQAAAGPLARAACVLLLGLSLFATAEIQLPEEQYFTQMADGNIAQARASFIALLDEREAAFAAIEDDHPNALELRLQRADALQRALTLWQAAEAGQNLVGNAPSPEVQAKMAEVGDGLAACAAIVAQLKGQPSTVPERLQRDVVDISRRLGNSLVNTAAFLRGSGRDGLRQRLLQEADRYVDAPVSVDALDQQAGGIARRLGVKAEDFSPRPRVNQLNRQSSGLANDVEAQATGSTNQLVAEQARNDAIKLTLQTYFEDLFAGRIFAMRSQFTAEYWPEADITYVMNKLAGCTLDSLGTVQVRPTSANEFMVKIDGLVCIDGNRGNQRRLMGDQLLLHYDGDRYRIAQLDAGGHR